MDCREETETETKCYGEYISTAIDCMEYYHSIVAAIVLLYALYSMCIYLVETVQKPYSSIRRMIGQYTAANV